MSTAQAIQLIKLLCETLRVSFRDMQEAPETLLMLEPNAQRWHSSIGRLSKLSWVCAEQLVLDSWQESLSSHCSALSIAEMNLAAAPHDSLHRRIAIASRWPAMSKNVLVGHGLTEGSECSGVHH